MSPTEMPVPAGAPVAPPLLDSDSEMAPSGFREVAGRWTGGRRVGTWRGVGLRLLRESTLTTPFS